MLVLVSNFEFVSKRECERVDILTFKAHIGPSNPALQYLLVFVKKGHPLVLNANKTYACELEFVEKSVPSTKEIGTTKTFRDIVIKSIGNIITIGNTDTIDYLYVWMKQKSSTTAPEVVTEPIKKYDDLPF